MLRHSVPALRAGECFLSPQCPRPEQDRQHNRPDNAPANPRNVRMSRLPFENALMDGHRWRPCLQSAVADTHAIFSLPALRTSVKVSQSTRPRWCAGRQSSNSYLPAKAPRGGNEINGARGFNCCSRIFGISRQGQDLADPGALRGDRHNPSPSKGSLRKQA
jgi:hypothetical protein